MKIMVIEDDNILLGLYREVLYEFGQIDIFSESKVALEHYEKNFDSYNLVIIDHMMPRKTGESIIFDMKYLNPNQKILLISGDPNQVNLPEEFGVEKRAKPITPKELKSLVNQMTGTQHNFGRVVNE